MNDLTSMLDYARANTRASDIRRTYVDSGIDAEGRAWNFSVTIHLAIANLPYTAILNDDVVEFGDTPQTAIDALRATLTELETS